MHQQFIIFLCTLCIGNQLNAGWLLDPEKKSVANATKAVLKSNSEKFLQACSSFAESNNFEQQRRSLRELAQIQNLHWQNELTAIQENRKKCATSKILKGAMYTANGAAMLGFLLTITPKNSDSDLIIGSALFLSPIFPKLLISICLSQIFSWPTGYTWGVIGASYMPLTYIYKGLKKISHGIRYKQFAQQKKKEAEQIIRYL